MSVREQSHAKPNSAFEKLFFYKYAIASLEHHLFLLHFLASCISRDGFDVIHRFYQSVNSRLNYRGPEILI